MTLLLHQSVQQEILETNAFNSSNVPYYVSLMKGNAWLQTADHQFISGLLIKVSGLLNAKSDANRWAASQLMILLIQEVPEKIVDKIAAWMNGLLGNLKKEQSQTEAQGNLEALTDLIALTRLQPDASKIMSQPVLSSILQTLTAMIPQWASLRVTIANCHSRLMQLFSSGLRPLKSALEKNLAELTKLGLDLQDQQLQVASINMAVEYDILLSSDKSAHKVSTRLSILETLIEVLNYTLGQLMICMEEDPPYGIPQIQDSVFAAHAKRCIVDDYKKQLPNLVTAFKTVSFLIKRVFMDHRFQTRSFDFDAIVLMASRVYSISSISMPATGRDPGELKALSSHAILLTGSVNDLISTVALRSQSLVATKGQVILSLSLRALERSQSATSRISALEMLTVFILSVPSLLDNDMSLLVPEIEKDWIAETAAKNIGEVNEPATKKRRLKVQNSSEAEENYKKRISVKLASLKVIQSILDQSVSWELPRSLVHQVIMEALVVSQNTHNDKSYEYYTCLIDVLTLMLHGSASRIVIPYALHLFSRELHSKDLGVQQACRKALAACGSIIHAQLPPLQRLDWDQSWDRKSVTETRKIDDTESLLNNSIIAPSMSMSQMLMAQPSTIEDQTSSAMEVEPTNAEPKPVAAPAVDTKTMTQEDHAKKKLDGIEAIQIPKMAQIESIRIPESVNVSQHVEEKVKPEVLMAGNESTQDDSDNSDDAISIPEINIDDSDEDE